MTTTINNTNEATTTFKTYRLMYFFGVWVTKSIIPAEDDKEAAFLAEYEMGNLKDWQHGVALFCGNRKVKTYK